MSTDWGESNPRFLADHRILSCKSAVVQCADNAAAEDTRRTRGHFSSDRALLKLFYLALPNIGKKWAMPMRTWKAALPLHDPVRRATSSTVTQNPFTQSLQRFRS